MATTKHAIESKISMIASVEKRSAEETIAPPKPKARNPISHWLMS